MINGRGWATVCDRFIDAGPECLNCNHLSLYAEFNVNRIAEYRISEALKAIEREDDDEDDVSASDSGMTIIEEESA